MRRLVVLAAEGVSGAGALLSCTSSTRQPRPAMRDAWAVSPASSSSVCTSKNSESRDTRDMEDGPAWAVENRRPRPDVNVKGGSKGWLPYKAGSWLGSGRRLVVLSPNGWVDAWDAPEAEWASTGGRSRFTLASGKPCVSGSAPAGTLPQLVRLRAWCPWPELPSDAARAAADPLGTGSVWEKSTAEDADCGCGCAGGASGLSMNAKE